MGTLSGAAVNVLGGEELSVSRTSSNAKFPPLPRIGIRASNWNLT
jgi:hypothetical protein